MHRYNTDEPILSEDMPADHLLAASFRGMLSAYWTCSSEERGKFARIAQIFRENTSQGLPASGSFGENLNNHTILTESSTRAVWRSEKQ
jgi:hypothetical protein